jgi:hypothetical protein
MVWVACLLLGTGTTALGQAPPRGEILTAQARTLKESLTPVQRKIQGLVRSTLARARAEGVDRSNAGRLNASQRFSDQLVKVDNQASIQVYIDLSAIDQARVAALRSSGDAEIEIVLPDLKLVQAWVPLDKIETLTALDFVLQIRAPEYATLNTGSVNSQGDSILKANQVRGQLGITGAGVKVGVISDGANSASLSQASGDLPSSLTFFGTCDPNVTGTTCNEGTAIMEIIYDLAPGVTMGMGAAPTTAAFIQRVNDLLNLA